MKHLHTFDEFVNESSINENVAMDMLGIFMMGLAMSGPAIALGIKQGAFDDMRTPVKVVKDFIRDKIVSAAIERLNQDPEVMEFLKLPQSQQRGKWQALLLTKLTDREMKHMNSISRYRVEAGKI